MATLAQERHETTAVKRRAITRPATTTLVVWIALIACGVMLAWLSILRYVGYNTGMFDLGNMAQAIASLKRGQPLISTFPAGATSRLAMHVEAFYLLLGLIYPVWPDPRLLLVIQAGLFALGALPVYRMALRHGHAPVAACCLALIYLLYPVAQTAVLFDMHGDTLAMPLLLFALDALDRRSWRWYGLWVVLALSCKFYVAVPVAVLGLVVWWQMGERRAGLLTTAGALLYGALAFLVVRPFFTSAGTSQDHRGLNYLMYYFGEIHTILATADERVLTAIVVFGPVALLLWRGWRWVLPALPIAGLVLISTNGSSYDYSFHHYALVVPFIVMAAIHGLPTFSDVEWRRRGMARKGRFNRLTPGFLLRASLMIVVGLNIGLVDTPLSPLFWTNAPGWGMDPSNYGRTSRDDVKDRFLATHVPPAVPLAASTFLAAHVTERDTLYSVRFPDDPGGQRIAEILPRVDYVVADALFDYRYVTVDSASRDTGYELAEIRAVMRDPAFGLVAAEDGLLMFQRSASAEQRLMQQVEVLPTTEAASAQTIRLADAHITHLGGRRYRASFDWIVPSADTSLGAYVAVSSLEGVPDARIVHLPTYALAPTNTWQPGQQIRETFELELPPTIAAGSYTWQVGWYDLHHSEAYLTDARSLVGETTVVTTITVP